MKPVYTPAPDVCRAVELITEALREDLGYIDLERIKCYKSTGARTRAIARIHGMGRLLAEALGIKPIYVIEVVSERFYELSIEERIKVLIHELLHIPRNLSGGLRPHGRLVNGRRVSQLYGKLYERKGYWGICMQLKPYLWC